MWQETPIDSGDAAAEAMPEPRWLSTVTLHDVARRLAIPTPEWAVVSSQAEATAAALDMGGPVALKADSAAMLHKSDSGGVQIGLTTPREIEEAFEKVSSLTGTQDATVVVQKMAPAGIELIVSYWVDEIFGPVVLVGSGGRLVELLDDVQLWLGPLTPAQARGLLGKLKCFPLLSGYRGGAPGDLDRVAEVISRLSTVSELDLHGRRVVQLEINPLIVSGPEVQAVDLRGRAGGRAQAAAGMADESETAPEFDRLFHPRTVAMLGASRRPTLPNRIFQHIQGFGYGGELIPVNSAAAAEGVSIHGRRAVDSIAELPETLDYGIVAVPATEVASTVAALGRRARFVQILTSGFGEAGEHGRDLQRELERVINEVPARVLGPNCLGLHSTEGRVTFVDGMVPQSGGVNVISQSGGLAADMLRQGQARGVRFSKVVTIGNAVDLRAEDLLSYFCDDGSSVIGLYLEGTDDGIRLRQLLQRARGLGKQVVLLHGGRSSSGARAVASHTGALSGDDRMWQALAEQCEATYVEDLDHFLTALAGASMLQRSTEGRVLLVGPSGGMSVLATDMIERLGLRLADLRPETIAQLDGIDVPAGTSLRNPIDIPAGALAVDAGSLVPRIVRVMVGEHGSDVDYVVVHLNPQNMLSYTGFGEAILTNIAKAVTVLHDELRTSGHTTQVMLALRPNGEPEIMRLCREVLSPLWDAGVPAFLGLEQALKAVRYVMRPHSYSPIKADHEGKGSGK